MVARPHQSRAAPLNSDEAETIAYDDGVAEGKQIVQREGAGRWRLGEIAHRLEPKYGDRTLAKFAEDIGIDAGTLERHRSVYRAWKDEIPAPGPELSYSVLRELADHPDHAKIVAETPTITKRQAAKRMRLHNALKKVGKAARTGDEEYDEQTRRMRSLLIRAHQAIKLAQDWEQFEQPKGVVFKAELADLVKQAAEAWARISDDVAQRVEKPRSAPSGRASAAAEPVQEVAR